MRKLLLIFLIIILLTGLAILITSGISIASFEIPSVQKIIMDNNDLDNRIAELDKSKKTEYVSAEANLNASVEGLQNSKKRYQDTINYSTEDEIKAANQIEKYKMSYLWTKIGMYATKNNIVIKADVSNGSVTGLYNISFTALGQYLPISEFIYAIEKDSKLGFKIDDFTLVPYSEEELQASFTIRNVAIDEESLRAGGIVTSGTTTNVKVDNNNQNTVTQ